MSKEHFLVRMNRTSTTKAGFIASLLYTIFVCLPIFVIVYILMNVAFVIMNITRFIKKTIKNAKTKFKSKSTKRVS